MPLEDAKTARMIHAEIARHYIDISRLDVQVMHGVVYLRGTVSPLRTHPEVDISHELERISLHLRQKPGIREVICEATPRTW